MTADINVEKDPTGSAAASKWKLFDQKPAEEIDNSIFESLVQNSNIQFMSQQIDDPEIPDSDKLKVAKEIFKESHQKFLNRFGKYLTEEQLSHFQKTMPIEYETQCLIKELQMKMVKRKKTVKNRRFAALKGFLKLEYFTEKEMMKREPHLYEQYIGQYLTDTEKKLRDGFDPENTPFSKVLLDGIDRDRTEELRKAQSTNDEYSAVVSKIYEEEIINEDMFPKIPPEYRKHWGDFDETPSTSSGCINSSNSTVAAGFGKIKKIRQEYITTCEKVILRNEFIELMHLKFLEGEDKDFDYSEVDDNSDLDDIKQINQDLEDAYFNGDDEDDDNHIASYGKQNNLNTQKNISDDDDDLDIFMKELNKESEIDLRQY